MEEEKKLTEVENIDLMQQMINKAKSCYQDTDIKTELLLMAILTTAIWLIPRVIRQKNYYQKQSAVNV